MRRTGVIWIGLIAAAPAAAQTTTRYDYDALGRLTRSTVTGGPQTTITYDPAGNRTNYRVTGAANGGDPNDPDRDGVTPPRTIYVVVPLNGYTIIPVSTSD